MTLKSFFINSLFGHGGHRWSWGRGHGDGAIDHFFHSFNDL